MSLQKPIIIITLLFIVFSCRKKEDTIPPVINTSLPISNQQFAFGDTITVSAKIIDDKNIADVSVSLLDENSKLIDNPISIHPNLQSYNLEKQITIDMSNLVSGKHIIQISANDGTNTTKSFVEINIESQQQTQEGVFVFSNNGGSCQVFLLNNNLDLQYQFNHQYSVIDAIVNSNTQQISILSNSGNLSVYNINLYNIAWTKENLNDFQNNFKGSLQIYNNYVFTSYRNGNIFGFDANGVVRQSATISESQYFPAIFSKHGDYLIVALENSISITNKIEKIYYSTGIPITNYDIDFTISEIFSYNTDKAIIWGNKNNIAKVCTLSVLNNVIYEIGTIPVGTLSAVEQIDEKTFLLCIDNDIITFNTITDIFSDYKTGIRADVIRYNSFNGYLYIADSNILRIYNYNTKTLIKEITHTNNIEDIEFWFNK